MIVQLVIRKILKAVRFLLFSMAALSVIGIIFSYVYSDMRKVAKEYESSIVPLGESEENLLESTIKDELTLQEGENILSTTKTSEIFSLLQRNVKDREELRSLPAKTIKPQSGINVSASVDSGNLKPEVKELLVRDKIKHVSFVYAPEKEHRDKYSFILNFSDGTVGVIVIDEITGEVSITTEEAESSLKTFFMSLPLVGKIQKNTNFPITLVNDTTIIFLIIASFSIPSLGIMSLLSKFISLLKKEKEVYTGGYY